MTPSPIPPRHSPAPWKPNPNNDGLIEDSTGKIIADVTLPDELPLLTVEEFRLAEVECAANAKLVLAAPRILAELQRAVVLFTTGVEPNSDVLAEMLAALEAATPVSAEKGGVA